MCSAGPTSRILRWIYSSLLHHLPKGGVVDGTLDEEDRLGADEADALLLNFSDEEDVDREHLAPGNSR